MLKHVATLLAIVDLLPAQAIESQITKCSLF